MLTGIPEGERVRMTTALDTAWTASATGSKLHLYKNDLVANPFSAVGDFVEADFVGYAVIDALIDWLNYRDGPTGNQIVELNGLGDFAAGVILAPQTVYGWYLTDDAGTVLHAFGRFDDAFTFTRNGDTLTFKVSVVMTPAAMQSNDG